MKSQDNLYKNQYVILIFGEKIKDENENENYDKLYLNELLFRQAHS